ncbi:MAG: 1,4-alpha-glucan branching enzyme, partial [Oscillospiraceae bacterium]|nr:1,4-alpha-glucan branching enzyme [Oscillospiraceae bacterium]
MYRGIFDQRRPDAPGCRPADGGFSFGVWAPNALAVSLVGDFNGWDGEACPMARGRDGIWRVFVPGLADGALYKYRIVSPSGEILFRADPCGRYAELRPGTASAVWRG